jgi:hypothetical protein
MRDELRGVLQEISGMPIMQGETFTPHHLDDNPVKRAWNWLTGKSVGRHNFDAAHVFGFQSADLFARYDFDGWRSGKEKRGDSAVQKFERRREFKFLRIFLG